MIATPFQSILSKTTLKTAAVFLLAACMGLAAAKDDGKDNKDGKGKGKGNTATTAAAVIGPAPAGDPFAVAGTAAGYFQFNRGSVVSALRDSSDGSVSFVWVSDVPPGSRFARGEILVRRIYTVNGATTVVETECRRAATEQLCTSLGL